jgi:hypothetical protein
MEAVQLGLADEIGDDTDAIAKAASLAGISGYELVDVNIEVDRIFVQQARRVFESLDPDDQLSLADLIALGNSTSGPAESIEGQSTSNTVVKLGDLRNFMLSGTLAETQVDPLPDFPLEINKPNIYYIYAGQSP